MKLRQPQSREPKIHSTEVLHTPETQINSFDWQKDFDQEQFRFINEKLSELIDSLQEADLSAVAEENIISILWAQELFWNAQVLEQSLGRAILDARVKEAALALLKRWASVLKETTEEELEIKFFHLSTHIRLHKTVAWLVATVPGTRQELGVNEELWKKWFPVFKAAWNQRTVGDHLDEFNFGDDVSEIEDLVAFALLFPDKLDTMRQELRPPNLNQGKGIPQDFLDTGMPELYVYGLGQALIVFPALKSQIALQQSHWEEVNKWQRVSSPIEAQPQQLPTRRRYIQAFLGAALITAEEITIDQNSQVQVVPGKVAVSHQTKLPDRLHA